MFQSETIQKIAAALAKFMAQVVPPAKDTDNPYYNSKYADLRAIIDAVKGPLSDNGLSFTQVPAFVEGDVILRTVIMHTSGEWLAGEYPVLPVKSNPQGYGSALTYARRYSLSAMLGIAADEDDDGNESSGISAAKKREKVVTIRKAAAKRKTAREKKTAATKASKPAPKAAAPADIEDLDTPTLPEAVDEVGGGNGDYGSFVIPIGKNKGQKMADVSHKAIQWYAHDMEPTTPDARALQAKAKAYLEALQPA